MVDRAAKRGRGLPWHRLIYAPSAFCRRLFVLLTRHHAIPPSEHISLLSSASRIIHFLVMRSDLVVRPRGLAARRNRGRSHISYLSLLLQLIALSSRCRDRGQSPSLGMHPAGRTCCASPGVNDDVQSCSLLGTTRCNARNVICTVDATSLTIFLSSNKTTNTDYYTWA